MTTPDIGLGNWFHQRAVRTPEREALRFEGTTFTYGELQGQIEPSPDSCAAAGSHRAIASGSWA